MFTEMFSSLKGTMKFSYPQNVEIFKFLRTILNASVAAVCVHVYVIEALQR